MSRTRQQALIFKTDSNQAHESRREESHTKPANNNVNNDEHPKRRGQQSKRHTNYRYRRVKTCSVGFGYSAPKACVFENTTFNRQTLSNFCCFFRVFSVVHKTVAYSDAIACSDAFFQWDDYIRWCLPADILLCVERRFLMFRCLAFIVDCHHCRLSTLSSCIAFDQRRLQFLEGIGYCLGFE